MGIHVEWDNDDQTIIRWTFSDPWVWADFQQAFQQTYTMMWNVDQIVHVLADARPLARIPMGNIMANIRSLVRHYPSNLGIHVAVSPNLLLRVMGETVGYLLPKGVGHGIYAVETMEEAYVLFERESRRARKS